jgi:CheY-like chemotaxis protein
MVTEIWVELIRLLPAVLWIVLVVVIVIRLRRELLSRFGDLTGLEVGHAGVKLSFIVRDLEKAAEASSTPGAKQSTGSDRSIVAQRANRNQVVLRGARLLWVDDNPDNNYYESSILKSLGVSIDTARTTEEALNMNAEHRYDVIISDMARGNNNRAGVDLLNELRKQRNHPQVIFYTMGSRPIPEGAFGITDRPDHLLHLVMDVLERERS